MIDSGIRAILYKQVLITSVISAIFILMIINFNINLQVTNPIVLKYNQYFSDFNLTESVDSALVSDMISVLEPESQIDILFRIKEYRIQQLNKSVFVNKEAFSLSVLFKLSGMFIRFSLIFLIVLALSYFLVQGFGLKRFIDNMETRPNSRQRLRNEIQSWKHVDRKTYLKQIKSSLILLVRLLLKLISYATLMSPGFVIAYFLKTKLDTNNFVFMTILALSTNGFLLIYIDKYYHILLNESKKGYVLTAIIKNLNRSYASLDWKQFFKLNKQFKDHILSHIYSNAQTFYFSSFKEQASFLISCLIILEMALNIQGNLCYELMRHILYENYSIATAIVFAIFILIKFVDTAVDISSYLYRRKVMNR